jgi:SAM-dependent methyltransferase
VLAALDLSSRQRVLDVGAGFGFWTLLASEAVGEKGHVLAIDSNPYCASLMDRELTAREVNNVEVQSCSLETLEQPSTPFDVILCKNALRFPEDQRSKGLSGVRLSPGRTVRRFWDLLDSGGRVVLIPLVTSNDCMPASEIVSLFEDTGFRILSEDDPRDFGLSVPDTPERCGTLLVAQKP